MMNHIVHPGNSTTIYAGENKNKNKNKKQTTKTNKQKPQLSQIFYNVLSFLNEYWTKCSTQIAFHLSN